MIGEMASPPLGPPLADGQSPIEAVAAEQHSWHALPADAWQSVASKLTSRKDLATLAATCRGLQQVCDADSHDLWSRLYQEDWRLSDSVAGSRSGSSSLGCPARIVYPAAAAATAAAVAAAAAPPSREGAASPQQEPSALPASGSRPQPPWRQRYIEREEVEVRWRRGECGVADLQGHQDYIRCAQLAGHTLVSASGSYVQRDCSIRVWDLREGRCLERLEGHEGPIWSVQYSGGRHIASAGEDGTMRLWDLQTRRVANGDSLGVGDRPLKCLSMDAEGGHVAAAGARGTLAVWSLQEIKKVLEDFEPQKAQQQEQADSGDGPDECFPSWDSLLLEDAGVLPQLAPHLLPPGNGPAATYSCIQVEGNVCAAGETDAAGMVHLYRVQGDHSLRYTDTLLGHAGGVSCMAFQLAHGHLAAGSGSGQMRIWSLERSDLLHDLRGHLGDVICLQLQVESLASGSADRSVRLWDLRSGKCTATLWHTGLPYCLQLDDRRLAAGCMDGTLHLWDLRSLRASGGHPSQMHARHIYHAHEERVWALAMDSEQLISAGLDGLISVRSFLPPHRRFAGWPRRRLQGGAAQQDPPTPSPPPQAAESGAYGGAQGREEEIGGQGAGSEGEEGLGMDWGGSDEEDSD